MGKTRYSKALSFVERLKNEEKEVLEEDQFIKEMTKILGSDVKRTIKPYIELMVSTGLIEEKGDKVVIK